MSEFTAPAETNQPVEEVFDQAYNKLAATIEGPDSTQLRVTDYGSMKVITAVSPRSNYQIGVTTQDLEESGTGREITVDVGDRDPDGLVSSILSVRYQKEEDPTGHVDVHAQVIAPPIEILTEADHEFIRTVGLAGALGQANQYHEGADANMGEYFVDPDEMTAVSNLTQAVTGYQG